MADSSNNDAPTLSAVPAAVASAAASAAATPVSLPSLDGEEREKSDNVSLADREAKGSAAFAKADYENAVYHYGLACAKQEQIITEKMEQDTANDDDKFKYAEILFLYGRTLFKIGINNSDVLGAVGGTKKKQPKSKNSLPESSKANATAATETATEKVVEGVSKAAEEAAETEVKEAQSSGAKKPLFQFTGDENFEDSDEEEEENGEEEEEEDDDLAIAFDTLEKSRTFFEPTLEKEIAKAEGEGKGKENASETEAPVAKHIKERLSEIHGLLTEIELENSRFTEAVRDARASLKYKQELYPNGSGIVASAHYMLSLALEFASITTSSEEASANGPKQVDQDLRDESIAELANAIESKKFEVQNMEVELAMVHAPEDNEATRADIAEAKAVLTDMEERFDELQKPLIDVGSLLAANDQVSGLLGAALGDNSSEAKARVEEAKKNAKDLSGLVRKKTKDEQEADADEEPKLPQSQPKEEAADGKPDTTNGTKRKAEDEPDGDSEESKKAKVEEPTKFEEPTAVKS